MGHFFDYCSTAISRKEITNISEAKAEDYIQYHVTAYDCSHISSSYIEQMKRDLPGGEHGAAFKSQVMAEFGTTDEEVVIPYVHIWRCVNSNFEHLTDDFNTGGLDLSRGGDETVLSVRNGNKLLKVIPFKFDNTQDTIVFLEQKFKENGLVHPKAIVFADAGGLGAPVLDQLKARGWDNIRYVLNQSPAYDKRQYRNKGAEMWFTFGKHLERGEILLCRDELLVRQLSTRYYKPLAGTQHQLESKLQARSKGHPSPDRADSVVLAFSNYKSKLEDDYKYEEQKPFEREAEVPLVGDFTLKQMASPSSGNYRSKYKVNGGIKDFSFLQEELDEMNRLIVEQNNK